MKGKVLVISRNAWNNSNSTGNTTSNFFSNWNDWEFANLFCRAEIPNNSICKKYFRISESDLIKNIFKSDKIGEMVSYKEITDERKVESNSIIDNEKRLYDYFRNNRWTLFLWAREILWLISKWKNNELIKFINEFNPDIIYMPIHNCVYMHNILNFVSKISKAKIVLITADDMYSLKQFSLSPLYWLNRFILRKAIRRSINKASICYSMSDIQIKELSEEFGDKFKVLRKSVDTEEENNEIEISTRNKEVITFVYTGNVTVGRWETLAIIGDAINDLNKNRIRATLEIYSANKITREMNNRLNSSDEVKFMGPIDSKKVKEIQRISDVVVHAESFRLKYKLQTRLSFSTKLVDYFQNGKCIFAVGWNKSNSIEYLINEDAAIVANSVESIKNNLKRIIESPSIISEYASKAKSCGLRNHNKELIGESLREDFKKIII